jgi:hypothetical protein
MIKIGVVIMASLIALKECLASSIHITSEFLLNIDVICFVSSAKLAINLLIKFIVPRKDWMSLFDIGRDKFLMASTLFGSILTPLAETICPSNLPSLSAKLDFLGLREIVKP